MTQIRYETHEHWLVAKAFSDTGHEDVLRILADFAHEVFLAGGAVRDLTRRVDECPRDLDLLIPNHLNIVHERLESVAVRSRNRHGNSRYRFARGAHIDVIQPKYFYREFSEISSALAFFDTSVNALAISLDGATFLDPLGGLGDLAAGNVKLPALRWTSMDRFESVHLLMRLVRLTDRIPLKVSNPELLYRPMRYLNDVDWAELRRLNGFGREYLELRIGSLTGS